MQKTIGSFEISTAVEGVLIPKSILIMRHQRQCLLDQAQRNASQIIKQAEKEAKSIRESAYCAGYQAGVLMSVKSIADYIDNSQELYLQFIQQAQENITKNLQCILGNEEFFLTLFSRWSEEIQSSQDPIKPVLHLLLPSGFCKHRDKLLAQIRQKWSDTIKIENHDENRFVIKYKNKLAEFSPDIWIANQKIPNEYIIRLKDNTDTLSKKAIEQLLNELAKRLVK
ncbi:hypothetical protein [Rouxiella sp. WC2420]|uniref:Oxygen-regulated invasion protein OrgB n=1 Tax=Rouxiella sp. WC2420 TaxID=3234145 RepID=A0AB39VL06_9GAMM